MSEIHIVDKETKSYFGIGAQFADHEIFKGKFLSAIADLSLRFRLFYKQWRWMIMVEAAYSRGEQLSPFS